MQDNLTKLGKFMATGIGSLPHTDPVKAVQCVLANIPHIPFWPQLPKLSPFEGMAGQYTEKLPGIQEDWEKVSFLIDTTSDLSAEMEEFYNNFMSSSVDHFKINEGRTKGLTAFREQFKKGNAVFLKGHITGPITLASIIKDEAGKDIIHNEVFYDTIIKGLAMKAAWQIAEFSKTGMPVIIFMDEPSMVSFGSAYSTLAKEDILKAWDEIIDIIHNAGGIAGIHCCGNTEWSVLFESKCDIVNFDSFEYFDKMALYIDHLKAFLSSGKKLAWGAVPSDNKIINEDIDSISERIEKQVNYLIEKGIPLKTIAENSIVTPTCGMGTQDEKSAEKILEITGKLSKRLNEKFC